MKMIWQQTIRHNTHQLLAMASRFPLFMFISLIIKTLTTVDCIQNFQTPKKEILLIFTGKNNPLIHAPIKHVIIFTIHKIYSSNAHNSRLFKVALYRSRQGLLRFIFKLRLVLSPIFRSEPCLLRNFNPSQALVGSVHQVLEGEQALPAPKLDEKKPQTEVWGFKLNLKGSS
jgi:hypothetical protein